MPYIQKGFTPFTSVKDTVEGVKDKITSKSSAVNNAVSKITAKKDEIKNKLIKKVNTKAVTKGATKVAKKVGSKLGTKLIPGVGQVATGAELLKEGLKQKAKGYAQLDKKSPGTSEMLETGAYGNQNNVRGSFFGSMK